MKKYDYDKVSRLAEELYFEIEEIADFHGYNLYDFSEQADFEYDLQELGRGLNAVMCHISYIEKESQDSKDSKDLDDLINGE